MSVRAAQLVQVNSKSGSAVVLVLIIRFKRANMRPAILLQYVVGSGYGTSRLRLNRYSASESTGSSG